MLIHKTENIAYRLIWYHDSLDYPCDFCGLNSYHNFHINRGDIMIVVCEDCLAKAKE